MPQKNPRVGPPYPTKKSPLFWHWSVASAVRDVSFYNIFWAVAEQPFCVNGCCPTIHMIFPYECWRIMGSYPIKYKYPLFFLVSTKTTNQPKRCSTVSPLSSWTSIKLLSSELVSSPHVCVHTELSSDYFCMENLGTLSPKLTLYWCSKKWFILSSFKNLRPSTF